MALTLDPKKAKISKRRHGEVVTVEFYREHGFLPWGFCNFMVLLGWSPGDDREVFLHPLDLIQAFTLERIRKGNSVFNYRVGDPKFITDPKALSMNADHIRQLAIEELIPFVEAWFKDHDLWDEEYAGPKLKWFVDAIDLLRPRCHTLEDFTELCRAYFSDDYPTTKKALKNIRKDPVLADAFNRLADAYAPLDPFDLQTTEQSLRALCDEMEIRAGLLINGTRAAVTGQTVGPGLFDVLVAVGKDRTVARLRTAAEMVTSSD
jgi:glutamyl-tRNA synthetase